MNSPKAAVDLAAMLPLEMTLIERNSFAKGMTLHKELSAEEATTREYEIEDSGYWDAGPDLAIFYDDIDEHDCRDYTVSTKQSPALTSQIPAVKEVSGRMEVVMDPNSAPEQELIRLAQQYQTSLHRMCYAILRDEDQAQDAVQEMFLKVYQSMTAFRGKRSKKEAICWIVIGDYASVGCYDRVGHDVDCIL